MTAPITRIVDAHLHFWDPARTDWYPYLADANRLQMGDLSGMCRPFSPSTYREESAGWPVEKVVHVCAAGPAIADETRERDAMGAADDLLAAVVGGVRSEQTTAESIELIDEQMASPRFRGVRTMGQAPGRVPNPDVLRALEERDLVFDLLARPEGLAEAAKEVAACDELVVVVEHAGWPRSADPKEFAIWKEGIHALAERPQTLCKLSGLSAPHSKISPEAIRPWLDYALEVFGVDRCFFASNFPVDSCHGTFHDLYGAFDSLTQSLDGEAREKLFASNAERIYRC